MSNSFLRTLFSVDKLYVNEITLLQKCADLFLELETFNQGFHRDLKHVV